MQWAKHLWDGHISWSQENSRLKNLGPSWSRFGYISSRLDRLPNSISREMGVPIFGENNTFSVCIKKSCLEWYRFFIQKFAYCYIKSSRISQVGYVKWVKISHVSFENSYGWHFSHHLFVDNSFWIILFG